LTTLQELTGKEPTFEDTLWALGISYTYYANQVCSIIKQIHKKSNSDERGRLGYYLPPITSMIKKKRTEDVWVIGDEWQAVHLITTNYLIDDFNYDQLVQLRQAAAFPLSFITEAIAIGKQEEVYSIPYLLRILEGMEARRAEKIRKLEGVRKLYQTEEIGTQAQWNRMDIALRQMQWRQNVENAELQERVDRLYKEGK